MTAPSSPAGRASRGCAPCRRRSSARSRGFSTSRCPRQRRRADRPRRPRLGAGRELPPRGARPAAAERAAAGRCRRARERAGRRRLRRSPQRTQAHLLLPPAGVGRALAVRAGARALGPVAASTVRRSTPARAALVGTHLFTAFTPTETDHVRFERDVLAAHWDEHGESLEFWIEADSFMRQMIRALVGRCSRSPRGRRSARGVRRAARRAARSAAGQTLPPHGLYLARVVLRASGAYLEPAANILEGCATSC